MLKFGNLGTNDYCLRATLNHYLNLLKKNKCSESSQKQRMNEKKRTKKRFEEWRETKKTLFPPFSHRSLPPPPPPPPLSLLPNNFPGLPAGTLSSPNTSGHTWILSPQKTEPQKVECLPGRKTRFFWPRRWQLCATVLSNLSPLSLSGGGIPLPLQLHVVL